MEVAGAADVVVQDRRAVRGLRRRPTVEPVLQDRHDALVGQRADLDGAATDGLRPNRLDAAEQTQHPDAGSEALLRMRPADQHGDDQRLGVRSDGTCLALEPLGAPLGRRGSGNLNSAISGGRIPDEASLLMNRSDDEQTTSPEPHAGLQGEGGLGGHQGRQNAGRSGAAV